VLLRLLLALPLLPEFAAAAVANGAAAADVAARGAARIRRLLAAPHLAAGKQALGATLAPRWGLHHLPTPACTAATPPVLPVPPRLYRRTYIKEQDPKRVYYMSMEFLMGRSLLNALNNLGIKDQYTEAITELGYKLEILVGGLGGLWQGLLAGRGWVGGWVMVGFRGFEACYGAGAEQQ
jgi:hypothetical protein